MPRAAKSAWKSACGSSSWTGSGGRRQPRIWSSATPVTAGCRMIKSAGELALMQRATDITILAFKAAFATLRAGMSQYELGGNITAALTRLGGSDAWALVGFGKYSAFPHGSVQPQRLERGDIVLLDFGMRRGGLSVGRDTHDRVRPAHPAADGDLEPGAKGPGRRVRRGAGWASPARRSMPPPAR